MNAKDYSKTIAMTDERRAVIEQDFQAGWDAACSHFCKLPLDELVKELSEWLDNNRGKL